MKIYSKNNCLIFNGEGVINAFPNNVIGTSLEGETITFVDRGNNNALYVFLASEITDESGQPYGNATQTNEAILEIIGQSNTAIQDLADAQLPKNSVFPADAKALPTIGIESSEMAVLELLAGITVVNKAGRNTDVDTTGLPEDLWNGGGTYTGFPSQTEELQLFSSSASDTGVVTFLYLASNASTAYQTGTATLNGTTPVNTGITAYRVHSVSYNTGTPTGTNVGNITVRHRNTTANVFCFMPIGTNQTYVGAYTIPAGNNGLLKGYEVSAQGGTTAEGVFWIRQSGQSPRYRRNFGIGQVANVSEIEGGLLLPPLTDIIPRITACASNNTSVTVSYSIKQFLI
jgi:hypothetical protein